MSSSPVSFINPVAFSPFQAIGNVSQSYVQRGIGRDCGGGVACPAAAADKTTEATKAFMSLVKGVSTPVHSLISQSWHAAVSQH